MAFIDELTIHVSAGRGGDGVVRWRHEKGKEFSGPAGGNGGKGGDVYVVGVRDINLLSRYRNLKSLSAQDGRDGGSNTRQGEYGEDLFIAVPLGSVITNRTTDYRVEILHEEERKLILNGGRGGVGNEHFKSSVNRSPREHTNGEPGEVADINIELQLIADAGLVGFPNAGKTSLLNALTKTTAKVAQYPFTTLEPNLGVFFGFVLADIPGLIEGAAQGRGLGHKFLRHIVRTKLLVHCISLEEENPLTAYHTFRTELEKFSSELLQKPELVVLTKTDAVSQEVVVKHQKAMESLSKKVTTVSILDDDLLKVFGERLAVMLSDIK